jgi:hypothetical protein
MTTLKDFYSQSSEAVRSASENSILVVIHDGFWVRQTLSTSLVLSHAQAALANSGLDLLDLLQGPSYWRDYDPLSSASSTSTTSPDWLVVDTHQYYAFEQLVSSFHYPHLHSFTRRMLTTVPPAKGRPPSQHHPDQDLQHVYHPQVSFLRHPCHHRRRVVARDWSVLQRFNIKAASLGSR